MIRRRNLNLSLIVTGLILFIAGLLKENAPLFMGVPQSELLMTTGLFLAFAALARLVTFQELALTKRLGRFIPLLLLFWAGIVGLEALSPWEGMRLTALPLPVHTAVPWLYALLLFLTLAVGAVVVLIVKSLIYVQQSRSTSANFIIMGAFILLRACYFSQQDPLGVGRFRGWEDYVQTAPEVILISGLMLFVAINGFRCKWIHHLTRGQKVTVFFVGLLLNAMAHGMIIGAAPAMRVVSTATASILRDAQLFVTLYMSMALLGILFQLPSAGLMDRRMREIHFLQGLGATLGTVRNREELIAKTTELGRQVIAADGAWLELKSGESYWVAGVNGLKPEVIDKIPDSVIESLRTMAKTHDHTFLINDVSRDRRVSGLRYHFKKTGAILVSTIRFKRREIGTLYTVSYDRFGFVEESRGLLKAFSDQVGVALENMRLMQVTIDQKVYKEELRVAHDAQMSLLPQTLPGLDAAEISAFCETANEIGGDFYDFIPVGSDRVDIIVGDVSGKGASAAFYMAELKGVVQAAAPHFQCPKAILTEINQFVRKHFESDTFVTMIYGVYNHKLNTLELARAGHTPMALVRDRGVTWSEPEGLGLGLATNDRFERTIKKEHLSLEPGDLLFFMTDGLIEARDTQADEFGETRLTDILAAQKKIEAAAVIEDVKQAMEAFSGGATRHDDVTMVALTLNEKEEVNRVEGESQ